MAMDQVADQYGYNSYSQVPSQYGDNLNIVAQYDTAYNKAWYAWNSFFPLAERDMRFYLGDQWDEQEKQALFSEGRSTFVFNRVRPNIQMVTGYQKKHRLSSVAVPIENSDQLTSDQYTKLIMYAFQYGDAYDVISDCFAGALITGWNLLSLWMDYRDDPINGDLRFGREPYNAFICDPYFFKKDLTDCSYLCRRKYISLEQAQSLLPSHKKELDDLYHMGWERDAKFTWLPYQRLPNGQKMMAYDEFWEQGFETIEYTLDVETGVEEEYDGDEMTLGMFPTLIVIKKTVQYVLQHIIVNNRFMKTEKNPYGLNEYPFVPFFAIFQPESDQWSLKIQSLIRTMIDPQRESNRRRSQMTDLVDSQINSGYIATEKSCVNPRSLYQTGQGKVIWKTADAAPDAITKIPPAQIPPSFFQLQQLFDKDIMDVANISQELLGQADSEQDSGLKVFLRQSAALVGLQDLFDNLRLAQELTTKKCVKLMTANWNVEKMKRILGEEPSETLKNKQSIKYDIAVQEGVLTDTQQEMFFKQLLTLKEIGEPMPPGLLSRAAPLQGKTEYNKAMEEWNKQQQAAQAEQAKQQAQMMQTQSEFYQSQSVNNIASAKERFTRAVANMGLEDERASMAIENRSDAVLKRAQAMKQLAEMDDKRIMNLLDLFTRLDEISRQKEEEIKKDDVRLTAIVEENQPQLQQQQQPQQPQMGGQP